MAAIIPDTPTGAYIKRPAVPAAAAIDELHLCHAKTPRMTFAGQTVIAKCVNIYDGDTAQFVWWVEGRKYCRFTCRMAGYNSAEIRGTTEIERETALANKQILCDKILNKIVQLDLGQYDKYGRVLVTVTFNGIAEQPADMLAEESVNAFMIRTKNGFIYRGVGDKAWK